MVNAAFMTVIVICTLAYVAGAVINGDDFIDGMQDATEPTGLVSGLEFILDLAVGVAGLLWSILTLDIGLPATIRFIAATLCGLVIAITAIQTLFGALS